jgi:hypothetical protein
MIFNEDIIDIISIKDITKYYYMKTHILNDNYIHILPNYLEENLQIKINNINLSELDKNFIENIKKELPLLENKFNELQEIYFNTVEATDKEVSRYYYIIAHLQCDKYIDLTKEESDNIVKNRMNDFFNWVQYDNFKSQFRKEVKRDIPYFENKFNNLKEKYFSIEEITKRENNEFVNVYCNIGISNGLFIWDKKKRDRYIIYAMNKYKQDLLNVWI